MEVNGISSEHQDSHPFSLLENPNLASSNSESKQYADSRIYTISFIFSACLVGLLAVLMMYLGFGNHGLIDESKMLVWFLNVLVEALNLIIFVLAWYLNGADFSPTCDVLMSTACFLQAFEALCVLTLVPLSSKPSPSKYHISVVQKICFAGDFVQIVPYGFAMGLCSDNLEWLAALLALIVLFVGEFFGLGYMMQMVETESEVKYSSVVA